MFLNSMKTLAILLIFLGGSISSSLLLAQEIDPQELTEKTDEELLQLWEMERNDTLAREQLARLYLKRAREAGDTIKMARGYGRLAVTFGPEKNIAFADSIIQLTKELDHIAYPALGHMVKAVEYKKLDSTRLVYEELLLADRISRERRNITQQMYVSGRIIMLQAQWGNKQKALEKQIENHRWLQRPDIDELFRRSTRPEMHWLLEEMKQSVRVGSYRDFFYCYYQLGQLEQASIYLDSIDGILTSLNSKSSPVTGQMFGEHSNWLQNARVEMLLRTGKLEQAVSRSDMLLQERIELGNPYGLKSLYFTKGMAQMKLGLQQEGLAALERADSINRLQPSEIDYTEDKELYTALYNEYQRLGRYPEAIESLDIVIDLENRKNEKYAFLEPALMEEFETPVLLEEKEALIEKLSTKNRNLSTWQWIMGGLLLLSIGWGIWYYYRQRQFRRRFDRLLQTQPEAMDQKEKVYIPSDREEKIVTGLEKFETSEGFRDKDLNLNKLAKKLKTNSNYLSRVINLQFGKNLSQYLHDLRIEYAKDRLLKDPRFRLYTVKAIAEESGYRNVESFSLAFYKRHGIYPSYYIKQLNKSKL